MHHSARARRLHSILLLCTLGVAGATSRGFAWGSATEIEQLARKYRMQVYESYRLDRREYDLRRQVVDQAIQGWRQRGEPAVEVTALRDWLIAATQLASQQSPEPVLPYAPPVLPLPAQKSADESAAPMAHPAADEGAAELPTVVEQPVFASPSSPQAASTQRDVSWPTEELPPLPPWEWPMQPAWQNQVTTTLASDSFPSVSYRQPLPDSAPQPLREESSPPLSVDEILPAETSASATLERGIDRASIDLDVLAAKARHYNLELAGLESVLSESSNWNIDRLEEVARSLQQLLDARGHLSIYYDAVDLDARGRLQPIDSPSEVLAQFAQRMFEVRIQQADQVRRGEATADTDGNRQLAELFVRLKNWTRSTRD